MTLIPLCKSTPVLEVVVFDLPIGPNRYVIKLYCCSSGCYDARMYIFRMGAAEDQVPVFICKVVFPTVPCLLKISEPQHRLMVRQCIRAGTKEFGMCNFVKGRE